MTTQEKIQRIRTVLDMNTADIKPYFDLSDALGGAEEHYQKYQNAFFDDELSYLPLATFDQCAGLLIVLLREGRCCDTYGRAFASRFARGQVTALLVRMLETLSTDAMPQPESELHYGRYSLVYAILENQDDTPEHLLEWKAFLSEILLSFQAVIDNDTPLKSYILQIYPKFQQAETVLQQRIADQ